MFMKIKYILLVLTILIFARPSFSQGKKEAAVAAQVEALKKAMTDADSAMLDKLTSDQLSYGHSNGAVEQKNIFIQKIFSGKSDFVSISLSDQTVSVSGKTALVRHKLDAVTNNDGKPGEVHLLILLVWQKQGGSWKLLARQAVKQP
jgi:ketosteroid isomerase-like protein